MYKQLSLVFFTFVNSINNAEPNVPIVITTWQFYNSTSKAWDVLKSGGVALDAIEMGATECEILQCDGTVGYGGSPDENSETTLDALIMDGKTMNVGAVGALRRVKNAISVARRVLDHTKHSIIVGELATEFAVQMGFQEESLITPESKKTWKNWHSNNCQPNFWVDVTPDPSQYCGPYHGLEMDFKSTVPQVGIIVNKYNHDTIGMIAVDENGNVAAGTSTNGAKFKIPGRIGDSPIPGAGAYADNEVGGAASTGDGDIMLRFLPSFIAVEEMRRGSLPTDAATTAIKRIATHYPSFMGAVIALSKNGEYGAACHGMSTFPFIVQDKSRDVYEEITVKC